MVKMSLEVELAIFGHQVPFIAEHSCRKWPELKKDKPEPKAADKWDTLALLIEQHNDCAVRKVRRALCPSNRFEVDVVHIDHYYRRGDWASEQYFLIALGVVDELAGEGCLAGTPHMGYTDDKELQLTDRGRRALVDHLHELAKKG